MDRAAKDGYIKDYSGIRQTSDGRKFKINGATVWTITDKDGKKTGQAVRFDTFSWLGDDGEEEEMIVCEGGEIVPKKSIAADASSDVKEIPSAVEVAEASAAVEAQAAEVRRLKEEDGLGQLFAGSPGWCGVSDGEEGRVSGSGGEDSCGG